MRGDQEGVCGGGGGGRERAIEEGGLGGVTVDNRLFHSQRDRFFTEPRNGPSLSESTVSSESAELALTFRGIPAEET